MPEKEKRPNRHGRDVVVRQLHMHQELSSCGTNVVAGATATACAVRHYSDAPEAVFERFRTACGRCDRGRSPISLEFDGRDNRSNRLTEKALPSSVTYQFVNSSMHLATEPNATDYRGSTKLFQGMPSGAGRVASASFQDRDLLPTSESWDCLFDRYSLDDQRSRNSNRHITRSA